MGWTVGGWEVPELFEENGDFDSVGCLGCVEIDVWSLGGGSHVGGSVLGQLS